jgi:hypothetical protein
MLLLSCNVNERIKAGALKAHDHDTLWDYSTNV